MGAVSILLVDSVVRQVRCNVTEVQHTSLRGTGSIADRVRLDGVAGSECSGEEMTWSNSLKHSSQIEYESLPVRVIAYRVPVDCVALQNVLVVLVIERSHDVLV